jgi:hypothetical protein
MSETVRTVRLQLSRRKGFDLQAHSLATNGLPAVNCARPSRWGNRWTVKGREEAGWPTVDRKAVLRICVAAYQAWLLGERHWAHGQPLPPVPDLAPLRSRNLACWCKPGEPCHADALLEMANA